MARVIVAGVLVGWCAVTALQADVYYLKNGGKVEGRGEDQGTSVVVHLPLGSIRIDKREIERVVARPSILDLYADKLATAARTPAARYDLAAWCEAAGLRTQAHAHLLEVIALDPDHAGARARLGHSRVGTRWLTADELHAFNGEISFRGKWLTPETVASILQAEALQKRLAAAGAGAGGAGPAAGGPGAGGAGAGGAGAGGAGGQPIGAGSGGAPPPPGKPAPLRLARSIRPSQEFLDKYFVTNPFIYGSAGARIHAGQVYSGTETAGVITEGPVYYGPYPYDGWDVELVPATGVGVIGAGIAGVRAGEGTGTPRGGLGFGYQFGRPSDDFFLSGGVGAGRSSGPGGSREHFGHGFFGHFRQGDHRLRFSFR